MRFFLFLALSTLSLTASAQFWQSNPKPVREPFLSAVQFSSSQSISNQIQKAVLPAALVAIQLPRSSFNLEAEEDVILKQAKHNMRFRVYNDASYNFTALAVLYLQQNRFSEAKWYLLQSNNIAKQGTDTRHVLDNLYLLAQIKSAIGEQTLAMADLQEARELAVAKAMQPDITVIDNKIKFLQTSKVAVVKAELRYAEAVELENSKAAAAATANKHAL
ncbi:hypothetical protein [Mucilaginibacter sp. dw_454]|uniref:hypothetical protein n=1 Tax=Mucilaginibacter sp. dw_454 TaxID=2720079 RepID=UPI001BD57181|nr:hypothetical protein [Mucilaginibacter sp. dw_454]